jgi:catalase
MLHPRSAQRICLPRREFFGNNPFVFVNNAGKKQAVRYQIIPVAGKQYLSDADAKATSPNFLVDELRTRLAQGPVKFRLVVQLPNAGDPIPALRSKVYMLSAMHRSGK